MTQEPLRFEEHLAGVASLDSLTPLVSRTRWWGTRDAELNRVGTVALATAWPAPRIGGEAWAALRVSALHEEISRQNW